MQRGKKKTWVKPTQYIINIGPCRYCKEEMENTESFVAFLDKTKAHYNCMREFCESEMKSQPDTTL